MGFPQMSLEQAVGAKAQNHPDEIKSFRMHLCQLQFQAGLTNAQLVIKNTQELEAFIFGEQPTNNQPAQLGQQQSLDLAEPTAIKKAADAKAFAKEQAAKSAAKIAATVKTEEPKAEEAAPEYVAEATEAAATEVEAPVITESEVKEAFVKVASAHGRDALVALLAEFGATKLTEVKPCDYAAALEAARSALQGEAA